MKDVLSHPQSRARSTQPIDLLWGRRRKGDIKKDVDEAVRGMVEGEKLEIGLGVLFIVERSMLDGSKSLALLNRARRQAEKEFLM